MTIVELVLSVDAALHEAQIPHAFGGALALAYVAAPRATIDVDVNVFLPVEELEGTFDALAGLGLAPPDDDDRRMPAAGIRLQGSGLHALDVFPALDEVVYAEIRDRCLRHPFGPEGRALPFLSAEDLIVFKLSFGRPKDWVDLAAIASSGRDFDVNYIERQLLALRGASMHPRLVRMRGLLLRG